ncbi:hypothetical protein GCM10023216_10480 [Isoptericola chiayiensis]|uniref:Uncharacterized protein n=1 Tax=Isoptericola chiayiensis TaxID=579446 RepID=A0ABP8Y6L5_9MICO|nr:hypothetical protein [Isoptericola chiayiensis]NOW00685.1 hypothetical protein [Isoptericola chiayiensis]
MTDVPFTPLAGSPPQMEGLSAAAARAAAALATTRTDLDRLRRGLEQHRSDAVDAARQVTDALGAEADVVGTVLRHAATVLTGRAADLASERREAALALERRAVATARLRHAEADEAEAWQQDALTADPATTATRLWEARRRAEQACQDVAAAEADWYRAREAKESGSKLAAARLGGLDRTGALRLAAASGSSMARYRAGWDRGVRLAAMLATTFPDGSREDQAAARADLAAAIRAAGDDPVVWTAFWQHVTPAQVARVLGSGSGAPVQELAAGLAAWAGTATAAEQREQGAALVAALGDSTLGMDDRAQLVAGLFAGLPLPVFVGAADALGARHGHEPRDDLFVAGSGPVVVAVATGLSADPDAALDHLAPEDADLAAVRIRSWFGRVPPDGWPDGGAAVAGLLAVAVRHGSASSDSATQSRAALVVERATPELVGHRGLLGPHSAVPDEAARHVALAYEPYIPIFEEIEDPELDDGTTPGTATCVQPRLDAFELRRLIGVTSGTPVAADHWLGAADRYVARVADGMDAPLDASGRTAAAQDTVGDTGVVAGATRSPILLEARADQARTEAATGWLNTGLGLSTATARPAASVITTGAGLLLPPLLPDQVAEARETVLRDESLLRERFAAPLHEAATEADAAAGLDPEAAPARLDQLDPDSHAIGSRFDERYGVYSDLRRTLGDSS